MENRLELLPAPELFFGLVAPVGVDLDLVTSVLASLLSEMRYGSSLFRLTSLMREVPLELQVSDASYVDSVTSRIAYANAVRQKLGDDALAAMAVSAIRTTRAKKNQAGNADDTFTDEEVPLANQAYIIRQLKRPEEVLLLRSIYGKQFIAISAYSPMSERLKRIKQEESRSRGGLISDVVLHNSAYSLVDQDSKESLDPHGQNVRDAFPLGDVFIDARSRTSCEVTLRRFMNLLFGDNHITPSRDEYGMYLAKSAALRSSDLSRQVGAAVFAPTGEVVTLGCNEVPKAGGGTYWYGDPTDRRDFVAGFDPNDQRKFEILTDIINRLIMTGHLSDDLTQMGNAALICQTLLSESGSHGLAESQLMDMLEFGRIIHAEMSALSDAARIGRSVSQGTLYTTTFPCHLCAKHLVAAGLKRVVYLEPYPKSYATSLHGDSIQVESTDDGGKVAFEPFIGIAPYRYKDLFEKGKRKFPGGSARKWYRAEGQPIIDVYFPEYVKAEEAVVGAIKDLLQAIIESSDEI